MQTKKVKTSDLSGTALDWAVAKCRGFEGLDDDLWLVRKGIADMPLSAYNPSTDGSQAGPIIDREYISTVFCSGDLGESSNYWVATKSQQSWQYAYIPHNDQNDERSISIYKNEVYFGPTRLIAAMRCYVASKLAAAVDVPEELLI